MSTFPKFRSCKQFFTDLAKVSFRNCSLILVTKYVSKLVSFLPSNYTSVSRHLISVKCSKHALFPDVKVEEIKLQNNISDAKARCNRMSNRYFDKQGNEVTSQEDLEPKTMYQLVQESEIRERHDRDSKMCNGVRARLLWFLSLKWVRPLPAPSFPSDSC